MQRYILLPAIILALLLSSPVSGQKANSAAPDFVVAQYAGSIGYASFGAGYDIFKSGWRASFHFGTVPKSRGGQLNVVSGKLFYKPWIVRLSDRVSWNAADPGIMVSYHMGENFRENVPDLLSNENYYWWHTSLRLHIALESGLSVEMEPNRFFKKITLYSEFNTNDLYIVSFVKNASTLDAADLIKGGIGVRFNF